MRIGDCSSDVCSSDLFVDILYAVPLLFLIIVLVTVLGNNSFLIFAAIGAVEWLTMSRIVRGQTIAIRNLEFMDGARAIALPTPRILTRYEIGRASCRERVCQYV